MHFTRLAGWFSVVLFGLGCADDPSVEESGAPVEVTDPPVAAPAASPELLGPGKQLAERFAQLFPLTMKTTVQSILDQEPSCTTSTDEWDVTAVDCKLSGGGVDCSLSASAFEGKFFKAISRCDLASDVAPSLGPALLEAIAESLKPKGFKLEAQGWENDYASIPISRNAIANKTTVGSPSGASIPKELRKPYAELKQADNVGTYCGIAGTPPTGFKAMYQLTAAGRTDLLRDGLMSSNPVAQIYGYVGLLRLGRATADDREVFDALLKNDPSVRTCAGCMLSESRVSDVNFATLKGTQLDPHDLK